MSRKGARSASVEVAVALGASSWESSFISELVSHFAGRTVRRCVGVTDLLAIAGRDRPAMIIVDDRFPRLDVSTTTRLGTGDHVLVGVYGDQPGKQRLTNLGIETLIPVESGSPQHAVAALRQLCDRREDGLIAPVGEGRLAGEQASLESTKAAAKATSTNSDDRPVQPVSPTRPAANSRQFPESRVIAVWGPPGSPGRTHIAVTVAQQLSRRGRSVLLVDADTTCAGIGPAFCLTEEGSGLIAATHHAERGSLDPHVLARLARAVTDELRLLTGIPHIRRRSELRAAPLARVWSIARALSADVVIDIGSVLDDGSLALDGDVGEFGLASGGNAAAVTALAAADHLVAVSGCEPSAIARFASHVDAIAGLAPTAQRHIVVNRVRTSILPNKRATEEVAGYLRDRTSPASMSFVREDRAANDAAVMRGLTLFEHDRKSVAVADVQLVVDGLAVVPLALGA